jgi:hypothetical protein
MSPLDLIIWAGAIGVAATILALAAVVVVSAYREIRKSARRARL